MSDEPSRVDLSQHRYVLLESASFAGDVGVHLGALSSAPVPCRMPSSEWLLGSQGGECVRLGAWCEDRGLH